MATSLAGCRVGTRRSRGGFEEEPAAIEEVPDATEGGKVEGRTQLVESGRTTR
jgi:hypothetical protein